MINWHVWSVVTNRHKKVLQFLSELGYIVDFLYPMAEKKYNTKNGDSVRNVPIYSNYVFIKYEYTPYIHSIIEECPWISSYVGVCSDDEINSVRNQDRKNYEDLTPSSEVEVGSVVRMIRTPFAGWDATVLSVDGDKLSVSVTILGAERSIKCSVSDININQE